jgi:hypothetical protein
MKLTNAPWARASPSHPRPWGSLSLRIVSPLTAPPGVATTATGGIDRAGGAGGAGRVGAKARAGGAASAAVSASLRRRFFFRRCLLGYTMSHS